MRPLSKLLISLALVLSFSAPVLAYNPLGNACSNLGKNQTSAACNQSTSFQTNGKNPANDIVQSATNIVAMAAGLAAVIIIIVSGLTMASSGGEQEKVKKARTMLMSAIIGLVIVAFAWMIVTFVIKKLVT